MQFKIKSEFQRSHKTSRKSQQTRSTKVITINNGNNIGICDHIFILMELVFHITHLQRVLQKNASANIADLQFNEHYKLYVCTTKVVYWSSLPNVS